MSLPVSKPVSACLKAPKGKQHQATQTKTIIEVDEIILEKDTVSKPVSACLKAPKGIMLEKDTVKPVVEN